VIYAIRAVDTGRIKFGRAASVGKRVRELEVGCPFDLEIVAVADWPDEEEKFIHKLLDKDYVRGEWFLEGQRSEELITLMLKGKEGLDTWIKYSQTMGVRPTREQRLEKQRISRQRAFQASLPKISSLSSTRQSRATEMAHLFTLSLLTWESSTLRSIATSLSTERANGGTLRLVEH
jgi:hypothetical protein